MLCLALCVCVSLSLVCVCVCVCVSQVIRYGFFALKEALGTPPYFATWARCVQLQGRRGGAGDKGCGELAVEAGVPAEECMACQMMCGS